MSTIAPTQPMIAGCRSEAPISVIGAARIFNRFTVDQVSAHGGSRASSPRTIGSNSSTAMW